MDCMQQLRLSWTKATGSFLMSVRFWERKNLDTISLGFAVHVRSDLIVADLCRIVWVYLGLGLYIKFYCHIWGPWTCFVTAGYVIWCVVYITYTSCSCFAPFCFNAPCHVHSTQFALSDFRFNALWLRSVTLTPCFYRNIIFDLFPFFSLRLLFRSACVA